MASIEKRGDGWRARIIKRPLGIDESATFPTKVQASAWRTKRLAEILAGVRGFQSTKTVGEAIDHFIEVECPKRKGGRWDSIRLTMFKRHKLSSRPLSKVSSEDIASWRDERLGQVSPSSTAREMNLWRALFSMCVERKWLVTNPVRGVKRPSEPPARRRGISPDEAAAIIKQINGSSGRQVKDAFLLSLETACRAGELLGLKWNHVDLLSRTLTLPKTKNGDQRMVPLSSAAVAILEERKAHAGTEGPFTISSASLDTLFRRARASAAVELPSVAEVHFHDARSEAITRFATMKNADGSPRFTIYEVARICGHKNLNSLMFYFHSSAADLAKRLD